MMSLPGARSRTALIADRSPEFRRKVREALSHGGRWICNEAETVREARDKIVLGAPDALVLESELPGNENGAFLKRIMHYHPMPVVVVSRSGECGAARATGATWIHRETGPDHASNAVRQVLNGFVFESSLEPISGPASYRIIAIGSSTGGTDAVEKVLGTMPPDGPGIVIAQHIPKQFSASFAARLNRETPLRVREAVSGDVIRDGTALVAPGGEHMRVVRQGDHWAVRLDQGPKVWYQRPSVDVLFESVAREAAPRAVGVLLTGMGQDGAAGLKRMRDEGCWTIAQNEATCVVFGMPCAAIEAGAVEEVLPLQNISAAIQLAARTRTSGAIRPAPPKPVRAIY